MKLSLPREAKRRGELAELVFAERAMERGMTVSKPLGESAAYDFVVDCGGKLSRVQVRSVTVERAGTYRVSAAKGGREKLGYTEEEIDVLAAYVVPCETWYLIPVRAFAPVKSIHLCPQRESKRKFEMYRERWGELEPGTRNQRGWATADAMRVSIMPTPATSAGVG